MLIMDRAELDDLNALFFQKFKIVPIVEAESFISGNAQTDGNS